MTSDFVLWWFDTHFVVSTLLTPVWTWIWLLYSDGNAWREVTCWVVLGVKILLSRALKELWE